ncbi:MAG: hypothetical protein JF621_01930 [Streptomyces turgidiscabies]|nr:hypothetical protein [Streptomyces turgidiscabies]
MTVEPFPDLFAHLKVEALPSRRWVECASCIENKSLDNGNTDPQEWAVGHLLLHPDHARYRIVSQVGFRLDPTTAPHPVAPGATSRRPSAAF